MSATTWTTDNIPDLTSKTIIVTGGNSGLGLEAIHAYAAKNANIIMACRSTAKGEKAKQEVLKIHPKANITVSKLDLADLNSIRAFATDFEKNHPTLDILLNNAGIMMTPYQLTKDGFESQLGTNHLGHFALTGLLLDCLKNCPKSRVINVSSIAHKKANIDFDNLLCKDGVNYSPYQVYRSSKLANLLFTDGLQTFFETQKIDCMAVSAHPGVSDTNLFSHLAPAWLTTFLRPLMLLMMQEARRGALPELRASVDSSTKGRDYYGPDGRREMKGDPILVQTDSVFLTKENASKLWKASEVLTSIIYS
jgi:NAD(P)-dependent dehydrogenase (short-subunit alcohol dehydrogenase family)